MALIKCPECGTEVSSSAAACPKCGYPVQAKRSARIHWVVLVVLILFVGIASGIAQCNGG